MTTAGIARYQELTSDLAAWTAESALKVYAYRRLDLGRSDLATAVAVAISAGTASAVSLAVVWVRAVLERALRVPTPVADVLPVDDLGRLRAAVATVLGDAEPAADTPTRLERLARSEVLETGQTAVAEVIARTPEITGWRRQLDADPCDRCIRWAEDGRVFPKEHVFKRHFGCNCQAEIVTRGTA